MLICCYYESITFSGFIYIYWIEGPFNIYDCNIFNTYLLPVTCYLIGLGTSINLFIEVFGRAFNLLLGKKVCFEL